MACDVTSGDYNFVKCLGRGAGTCGLSRVFKQRGNKMQGGVFKNALDFTFFFPKGKNLGFSWEELSPAVALVRDPLAKDWCVGHLPSVPGAASPPRANPSGSGAARRYSEPTANLGTAAPPARALPQPKLLSRVAFLSALCPVLLVLA